MRVLKLNVMGSPFIGLFFHLFEDFGIFSQRARDLDIDIRKEYVSYPIVTPFFIEYGDKIIISKNAPREIIETLGKYFDLILVDTRENLIGNLFFIGKDAILYSIAIRKDVEEIERVLGMSSYRIKVDYYFGSIIKSYRDRILVAQNLSDETIDMIRERVASRKFDVSTVNFGSPFLRYGIEINKDYLIVGDRSTGHEIVKIEDFFTD